MRVRPYALAAFAATILAGSAIAQTTTTTTTQTITTEQEGRVKAYITKEKRPSVKVTEQVTIGRDLPSSVELHTFPGDVGVTYRYGVVNDRTVLVEPSSRKIVRIIE